MNVIIMICILTLMSDNKSTSSNMEEFMFVYVGLSFQSRNLTDHSMSQSDKNSWRSIPDDKAVCFLAYSIFWNHSYDALRIHDDVS